MRITNSISVVTVGQITVAETRLDRMQFLNDVHSSVSLGSVLLSILLVSNVVNVKVLNTL